MSKDFRHKIPSFAAKIAVEEALVKEGCPCAASQLGTQPLEKASAMIESEEAHDDWKAEV